jgi:hypothetical protein
VPTVTMIRVSKHIEFIDFTEGGAVGDVAVKGLVVRESSTAADAEVAKALRGLRLEHEELVVLAADRPNAVLFERLIRVVMLSQLHAARLVDAMLFPGGAASAAAATQAQRNAEARQELIDEFGLYGSDEIAEFAGSTATNRSATASRWLASGKIFAVNHKGARLVPAFQFGTDGQPRPVIGEVLAVLEQYGLDGWETALWFTTESGWLDDRRPVDLLTGKPDEVVEAARHAFDEVAA